MSSEQPTIVLFDIPRNVPEGQLGTGWSPNTLKTRIALGYKHIPFTTEWVEYPDIEPKFKALGVPPNATGPHKYSVPVIAYTPAGSIDTEYIMDSDAIAAFLDTTFPARQLYRGSPESQSAQRELLPLIKENAYNLFRPFLILGLASQLHPVSSEYFRRATAPLGPPEGHLDPPSKYDEAWAKLVTGLDFLAAWLDREEAAGREVLFTADEEGVKAPTYATLAFTGVLEWLHRTGVSRAWDDVLKVNDGRWATIWEAGEPYSRD